MNAINPPVPLIPDSAPFSPAQRAWLNGFLAGLYGGAPGTSVAEPVAEAEEFPWHDPALDLAERLQLAAGKPLKRRLMAAMAQLDCGQCGYLCQSYGEALAEGRETSTGLCVPGAKITSKALKLLLAEAPTVAAAAVAAKPAIQPAAKQVRVLSAERLTGAGSEKDVRHVVIDLGESGLAYEPGDSLSLATPNDPALVAAILRALGATGAEPVALPEGDMTLATALAEHRDIARPLDRATDALAMAATDTGEAAMLRRLSDGDDGAAPAEADLLDLLEAFPSARPSIGDLIRALPSLKPRLYSIASSPRATPGQVHLCVAVVRETRRGRVRHGVASGFLAARALTHGAIPAFVQTSHFRLPADPATPIVMVGPGTGVAPFRAFLQERAARSLRGKTWLFFGDRHRATDFLFGDELTGWLADGTLGRLDLAFSRDQRHKLYVQDRMREHAADLWRWLQDGAHFYVCGDATGMARDVDLALRAIAISEGRMDEAQARDWIVALARQGRYLRDIY
jgi:sulfite reductase (NADPH) flavoprotein alpha-component